MSQVKRNTLSTFKESIPLIYILLVCFGYFNKSLYFDKFDIDIIYYLTVQELVFSFIPVGSAIVILLLFMTLVIAPMVVFSDKEDIDSEMAKDRFNLYEQIDKIKNIKIKNIAKHIYWIISKATSIYLDLIPILLIGYFAIFRNIGDKLINSKILVVPMIIWGIIFLLKFKFQNSINKKNPKVILFVYFILSIVVFIVYTDINLNRAESIKNGKSDYSIHLISDTKEFTTDKELIFIGQTNDFIFLRNTVTEENNIYLKSDFNEIKIKKLKK